MNRTVLAELRLPAASRATSTARSDPGFSFFLPILFLKAMSFAPALPAAVSAPIRLSRTHCLALRRFGLGLTQRVPCLRPARRRETVIVSLAASLIVARNALFDSDTFDGDGFVASAGVGVGGVGVGAGDLPTTGTGTVEPEPAASLPSLPCWLWPQHHACLPPAIAHVCEPAVAIEVTPVRPTTATGTDDV